MSAARVGPAASAGAGTAVCSLDPEAEIHQQPMVCAPLKSCGDMLKGVFIPPKVRIVGFSTGGYVASKPRGDPRIRLALLTARRTAPHCLSEPLPSERIIRGSVGICPFVFRCRAMRQTSSLSNRSRSRVLFFWHRRYRDRIAQQRSGHFSDKFDTEHPT
jgi:hypothetical protein